MEMKIRESCLQTGTFIYKPGISVTKQDFHLQMGSLGLQIGFSAYYLPACRLPMYEIMKTDCELLAICNQTKYNEEKRGGDIYGKNSKCICTC